ncbi:hypothetical protein ACFL6U_19395 [Planctomycetota bacterium]
MASILVLLIIVGLAVLVFFKVPLVQALATLVMSLVSSFVAFGYYEMVGGLLAGFVASLATWASLISFLLLFVLVFAILQTGVVTLLRGKIDLGTLAERIGRPICGVLLGLIFSGVLLTALSLAPLSSSLPYARFDSSRPDPGAPKAAMLNPDGFVAGWFNLVSGGSFRALYKPAGFGVVRAGFIDQLSLNRLAQGVPLSTSGKTLALEVPSKEGVWYAPSNLTDAEGADVSSSAGERLMVVRFGIRKKTFKDASPFTLSQVSVVAKSRADAANVLLGTGTAVYPLGILAGPRTMARKRLTEKISIESKKVEGSVQWIDFVFAIPSDLSPVLARFKLNNAAALSAVVEADQAPAHVPFTAVMPSASSENASEPEAQ